MCEVCFQCGFSHNLISQSNIFHRWGSFLPLLLQLQIKWVERRDGAASQAVLGSTMNYSGWTRQVPGGQETGLMLGPAAQRRHLPNQHSSGSSCFIMNSVIPKKGNQGLSCQRALEIDSFHNCAIFPQNIALTQQQNASFVLYSFAHHQIKIWQKWFFWSSCF